MKLALRVFSFQLLNVHFFKVVNLYFDITERFSEAYSVFSAVTLRFNWTPTVLISRPAFVVTNRILSPANLLASLTHCSYCAGTDKFLLTVQSFPVNIHIAYLLWECTELLIVGVLTETNTYVIIY